MIGFLAKRTGGGLLQILIASPCIKSSECWIDPWTIWNAVIPDNRICATWEWKLKSPIGALLGIRLEASLLTYIYVRYLCEIMMMNLCRVWKEI